MESHLLQMRGLKHGRRVGVKRCAVSHLLQMRGLKLQLQYVPVFVYSRIFYRCVD